MNWQRAGRLAYQAWTTEALYTAVFLDGAWRAMRGQQEASLYGDRAGFLTLGAAMKYCEEWHDRVHLAL